MLTIRDVTAHRRDGSASGDRAHQDEDAEAARRQPAFGPSGLCREAGTELREGTGCAWQGLRGHAAPGSLT